MNNYMALLDDSGRIRITLSKDATLENGVIRDPHNVMFRDGESCEALAKYWLAKVIKVRSRFPWVQVRDHEKTVLWERAS